MFSLTGATKGYQTLEEGTGYGTAGGLCGINCKHDFTPYVEGLSKLPEVPDKVLGQSSAEYYELTQKQRRMEQAIRTTKKRIALGNEGGLPMTAERLRLGQQQKRLNDFCSKYDLRRDYIRERVWGVKEQPVRLSSLKWLTAFNPSPKAIANTINLRPVEKSSINVSILKGVRAIKPPKGLEIKIRDGVTSYLAFDGYIEEHRVFAGHRSDPMRELRDRYHIAKKYGGHPDRWSHLAGLGVLYDPDSGKLRVADIHWLECDGQVYEIKFKRWVKNE